MKWKNRLTNYNFWISIVSAVLLILQAFKFEFDIAYINEIATAVLGLLVVIGIISDPTRTYSQETKSSQGKEKNEEVEQEKIKQEIVEVKQEVKSDETKTHEVLEMPIEAEIENTNDNAENDFQSLVNKISVDINEKLEKINALQNALMSNVESSLKQEISSQTTEETPTCINIVNN